MSIYKYSNITYLYHSPEDDFRVETSGGFVIKTFRRIPERLSFVRLIYIYIYIYIYICTYVCISGGSKPGLPGLEHWSDFQS